MTEPPKLLDRVRNAVRVRHYSPRTEEAYVMWSRRFHPFPREAASFVHGSGGSECISEPSGGRPDRERIDTEPSAGRSALSLPPRARAATAMDRRYCAVGTWARKALLTQMGVGRILFACREERDATLQIEMPLRQNDSFSKRRSVRR